MPGPPRRFGGLTYLATLTALLLAMLFWKSFTSGFAPGAIAQGRPLAPASSFDPIIMVKASAAEVQPTAGTAFSVSEKGVWLTAWHVISGCRQIALMQSPGRAAEARALTGGEGPESRPPDDIAVLITRGGAPALALSPSALHVGETSLHPGFPQGRPGEVFSRLIRRQTLVVRSRGARGALPASYKEPVLAWAEVGRTPEVKGDLAGLSGAPTLNAFGDVVGVTLAEAPRRGRIYTTSPEAMRGALARAHIDPSPASSFLKVTSSPYGRTADTLRQALSVVQVVCLDH